jgi:hypothetical protein
MPYDFPENAHEAKDDLLVALTETMYADGAITPVIDISDEDAIDAVVVTYHNGNRFRIKIEQIESATPDAVADMLKDLREHTKE